MKITIDERLLEQEMNYLGFREVTTGTEMIRFAVKHWRPRMMMTKELYPMIAAEFGTTPARVERNMRHAIETAFDRADGLTVKRIFGYSISWDKGAPTVGEFVGRMARVCGNEIGLYD